MDQHIINVYELMSLGHTRKAKRRSAALEELSSKGWKNEETRAQIKKILKVDFMSSDEECDDGFITHPPSWQNDTFASKAKRRNSWFRILRGHCRPVFGHELKIENMSNTTTSSERQALQLGYEGRTARLTLWGEIAKSPNASVGEVFNILCMRPTNDFAGQRCYNSTPSNMFEIPGFAKEHRVVGLFNQDQNKWQTFTISVKSEDALAITQLNMP
uniref:Uncharacterized protein n=1 Tax=Magallana gigas TaxID=29159 RepID=A0A8W8MD54_MAGGI